MAARKGSTGASRGSSGKGNAKKSTAKRKTSTGTAKKASAGAAAKTRTKSSAAKSGRGGAGKRTGSTTGRKSSAKNVRDGSAVRSEVGILTTLALTLFGTFSVFGLCGSVGAVIRSILFGVFGILAYVVPLLFFLAVMFFISNLGNGKAMGKMLAALLIIPDLCGLIQLIASPYVKGESLKDIYEAGTGGGWLGGAVKQGLCSIFDVVGAYLILVLILLVCLVVITEKSITKWVRSGGERFLGRARDDYEYRVEQNEENRIRAEERKEEQRLQRENRRKQEEERRIRREKEQEEERARREKAEEEERRLQREKEQEEEQQRQKEKEREDEQRIRREKEQEEEQRIRGEKEQEEEQRIRREKEQEEERSRREKGQGATELHSRTAADGKNPAAETAGEGRNKKVYRRAFADTEYPAPEEEIRENIDGEGRVENLPAPETESEDTTVEWWNPHETGSGLPDRDKKEDNTADSREDDGEVLPAAEEEDSPDRSEDDESWEAADGVRRLDFMESRVNQRMEEFERVKTPAADTKPIQNSDAAAQTAKSTAPVRKYVKPSTSLLFSGGKTARDSRAELNRVADKLQETLKRFGVNVTITDVSCGPSVTRYELLPEAGTRVNRITSLSDDIKLALAATDIRIEAPIPGKSAIGIEVPNRQRETVYLKDLVESRELAGHASKIAFAAGKDIAGKVVVADIAKMPHMLIAGTTGSGKSVFTNSIIMTILFRATPDEVKLIIIDPKVVEFGIYNGIPHLMTPVVTDPRKAADALKWATAEMSRRYKTFADENVRDLAGYNKKIDQKHLTDENGEPLKKLPQIVIIIDELADLMMVAAKDVEETICRLAQLARAAGIHLIIATQRPSVDVVTGLIKANIPSRVALLVSSGTDSRTIIDMNGAEKLLGNGDMLFAPSGYAKPVRLQGAFVSDEEVRRVVDFLKQQTPEDGVYDETLTDGIGTAEAQEAAEDRDERDTLFADAGRFLILKKRASVSLLQRKFRIGFNRAARIIDQLEEAGVVGEEVGTKPRNVLMTEEEFETFLKNAKESA